MKPTQDFIEKILNTETTLYFINYDRRCIYSISGEEHGYITRAITGYPHFVLIYGEDLSFWNFDDFGKNWGYTEEELKPELERINKRYELLKQKEKVEEELKEIL